jgi:hypothetical protein
MSIIVYKLNLANHKHMKRKLEIIGLCIGWFAIIGQFVLMLQKQANGYS